METTIIKKRTSWNKGLSSWNKGLKGVQIAWNKDTKGIMKPNKTSFKKGIIPHNKGKKGLQVAWNKDTHITNSGSFKKGHKLSLESMKKLKDSLKGRISGMKGKHHTEESKEKNRQKHLGHTAWNKGLGNKTPENKRIWRSIEMRLWREAVFARDNYTCQKCEQHGGALRPHHIFNFATYLDLRFDITNGITLCDKCHRAFHKIYGNRNNTKEQLEEFLQNA